MRLTRVLFATLLAALTAMAFAQGATAAEGTVEISPSNISAEAAGELTFEDGGGSQVTCNITLSGTVVSLIVGEPGVWRLIGDITRGAENRCTGALAVSFLLETAWNVEARVFLDSPEPGDITIEIRINEAKFLLQEVTFLGLDCLYVGNVTATSTITTNPGTITSLAFPRQQTTLSNDELNSFFCPDPGLLIGEMGTNIGIRITLP